MGFTEYQPKETSIGHSSTVWVCDMRERVRVGCDLHYKLWIQVANGGEAWPVIGRYGYHVRCRACGHVSTLLLPKLASYARPGALSACPDVTSNPNCEKKKCPITPSLCAKHLVVCWGAFLGTLHAHIYPLQLNVASDRSSRVGRISLRHRNSMLLLRLLA